jgi:DMSO/TMAO reductase YedYZ heme-binding membrane subunit
MTALDLSADVGLLAVFLSTANICLGLLIAVRYSPSRFWPHRRINIFAVHNWTAYALLASVLTHPVILLFSAQSHWRPLDLALPVWSPVQPIENTIGAVSVYLIVVVVLTSYFWLRLGRSRWKLLHYLVYVAGICTFIHGILADTELKGNPIDPLDGEKLFVELCLLVVMISTVWAWRYRLRKDREERALKIGRYRGFEDANASD